MLDEALKLAEEVATGLEKVAWRLTQEMVGHRDKKFTDNFTKSLPLLRLYWYQLDLDFPNFLERLVAFPLRREPADGGTAMDFWRERLRDAAIRAWKETRRFVGTEARHLKALAEAEGSFASALAAMESMAKAEEVKG